MFSSLKMQQVKFFLRICKIVTAKQKNIDLSY